MTEDLQTFAHLSRALWSDSNEGEPIATEVLSAISLLDLSEEMRTERALRVLLEKAKGSFRPETRRLDVLFYRLDPRARFLLVSVQIARWSYARAGRVSGMSAEEVERELWATRLALASQSEAALKAYPVGTDPSARDCPEYDLSRPWTQRFLDEEFLSGTEKHFLQHHLMGCGSCRRALSRCRDVYYAVDRLIPRIDSARPEDQSYLRGLESLERMGRLQSGGRSEITLSESIAAFFGRKEGAAVGLGIVLLAGWLAKWGLLSLFRHH